jgi:tetratricopeptide (TPR) repeat protein
MRPRMNPSLSPTFYELDEYKFQDLCCDLFASQAGIATCDVYGTRGQKQRGIDLLARRIGGDGIEVGQRKCYRDFSEGEISKVSDEFFKHFAFWQQRKIKRFLLFVACDLDRTQQQDEIAKQAERFIEHGIEYEAWSANTLRLQLAPYPDIVMRHTQSEYWVANICGHVTRAAPEPIGSPSGLPLPMEFLSAQIERLSSELSRTVAAQLEEIRESYREGKRREAYARVQALQQRESWDILERPLQARILRMLATYALNLDRDISMACELANSARSLDPSSDDTVFRILLKYHTEGAESALREIGHPNALDTINLEVSLLLLGMGKPDEALVALARLPQGIEPNAETRRLHALALLTKGDLAEAHTHIQLALEECPKWVEVRIASAIVNYFSVLSPTVIPNYIVPWPYPVDWPFVRRDNQSLERLRRAKSEFEALTMYTDNGEDRKLFEVWCLACLANDPDRQTEAQEFCRCLLAQDPGNHRVVVWAVARNYDVDLRESEQALEEIVGDNEDELS